MRPPIFHNAYSQFNYYPYGMIMPGRSYSANSSYRFGFNGQEKDDEIAGAGNINTALYWEYDTRLGRRWNIEPLFAKYPFLSPYVSFSDNSVLYSDPDGKEIILPKGLSVAQKLEVLSTLQKLTNDKLVYHTLKDGTTQILVASLAKSGTETKVSGTNLIRDLNSSSKKVTIDV